ncbi:MAG: O-antigen ligase family protein [Clostridiales bacterium]|nr:O-antigen ligase family protein [Clostridiales bacterium]
MINLISKMALLWGILLSIYHFFIIVKRKIEISELIIYFFLCFTLFLNIIFYRTGENLKIWIVNCIMLTSVFYINKDKTKDALETELRILSNFTIVFTFILSSISTIMYISKLSITVSDTVYGANQGLYVYKNTLAIAAAISLILSLYCYFIETSNKIKIFYIVNIVLQLINVFYSKGRSALLILLAIPFVIIYLYVKNTIFRCSIILVPAALCIGLFAKFHDKLYDFLSARNELWYSAYLLFKDNLFKGVGNSSMVEKVYSMRPGVILPGIEDGGLHNIYLQMITSNGILSLIIFLAFICFVIYNITIKIDVLSGKEKLAASSLLILVFGILFVNVFESNLIYISSFISIIFWYVLGIIYNLYTKK